MKFVWQLDWDQPEMELSHGEETERHVSILPSPATTVATRGVPVTITVTGQRTDARKARVSV